MRTSCSTSARGGQVDPKGLQKLRDEHLIDEAEYNILLEAVDGDVNPKGALDFTVAELPWIWNAQAVKAIFDEKMIPPPLMSLLLRLCLDCRVMIDSLSMQMNSQLPFAYTHLITLLVNMATVLSAVICGLFSSLAETNLELACHITQTVTICTCLCGLLTTTAVIADPFGDDTSDFPAASLQLALWRTMHSYDRLIFDHQLQAAVLDEALNARDTNAKINERRAEREREAENPPTESY